MTCYHVSKKFTNLKGHEIELHIQRHSNYIQIKIVKSNSLSKTVLVLPLILLVIVIYSLNIYSHLQDFWLILMIGFLGALATSLALLHYNVTEESVLVIRSINGIQYNTKNLLGKVVSKFIKSTNVIINEAITMNQVISYLAVMDCESSQLTNSQQINLVFTQLMPKSDCLKFIYTHLHDFLDNKSLESPSM